MVNLLDLEYVISQRRAEIQRDIRQEALIRQLRSRKEVVNLRHERTGEEGERDGIPQRQVAPGMARVVAGGSGTEDRVPDRAREER